MERNRGECQGERDARGEDVGIEGVKGRKEGADVRTCVASLSLVTH